MLKKSKTLGGASNICVVSSMTGRTPNFPIGVYGMTKASLDNMVVFLSKELLREGIRVNGIAPGLIKTDFADPLIQSNPPPESIGQPENIGSVVALICSPEDGAFMNGEIYHVNGGFAKM